MARSFATLTSVAVAAALFQVSEAHSSMSNPKPYWPERFYNPMNPVGTVDSTKFSSQVPGWQGVEKFKDELGDGDLRDFVYPKLQMIKDGIVDNANKECGMSLLTGAPIDLPTEIDFPWGHPGPCAAYCDDVQFFKDFNCAANVKKITVDKAKCANAKRLQVMYVGVHVPDYQYYVNCLPLKGSGSGSAPAPAPAQPNPAPAPAPQPNPAPAPQPNPAPAQPNPAPAPQPNPAPAPTPSKNNCVRRLRN